jgi:arylsulfate sulfotransferase
MVVMLTRSLRVLASAGLAVLGCSSSPSNGTTPPAPTPEPTLTPEAPPPAPPAPPALAPAARLTALSISTGSLVPAFSPDVTDYTVTSLNALHPIDVTASADPALTFDVNGHAGTSGAPVSFTLQPRQDVTVTVRSAADESHAYVIHYLPADLPTYSVAAEAGATPGTEPLLLSPDLKYLLTVGRDGAPLYYRTVPGSAIADFQQHDVAGAIRYSFAVSDPSLPITPGVTLGTVRIMDDDFHDLGDVMLLPHGAHGALRAELHDFVLLGDHHYVAQTYVERTVDLSGINGTWSNQAPVYAAVVQEVDNGVVKMEWDASDYPSLYTDSVDGNAFTSAARSDYLHLNSVLVDPADDNIVVSLRHTDSIVKIDHVTGNTLWTLGGASDEFGIQADQRFSHQHHVRKLEDGRYTVFDNGNNAHATRVLAFTLDEAAKTITDFDVVYDRPSERPDSGFMGSAVFMGDERWIIGWGGFVSTASIPSVTEIVDGAPAWSLAFTKPTTFSYRALPMLAD